MLGNGKKITTKSELKNKLIVRKSIVARTDIKKGDKFSDKNLTTKRPASGTSPTKYSNFLKKISKKNYKKNNFVKI